MATKKRAKRSKPNVVTTDNDNLSGAIADLVPQKHQGTKKYLDIVQWNIEWFGAAKSTQKDKRRRDLVLEILDAFNGDLFVFQEVAGPSKDGRRPGILDSIAADLTQRGAGDYAVDYTLAGGEQRVAMMWDRNCLRAKGDVEELFPRGKHKLKDKPDPFAGRTPLYGYYSARMPDGTGDAFDFQILGVHLKAMADGHGQRLESAGVLATWLESDAKTVDSDVLIMGDWNAGPTDKCWEPFHKLEVSGEVAFRNINDPTDYSYLWLRNKKDKFMSRIDLTLASMASMKKVVGQAAQVVKWKPIEEALAIAGDYTDKEVMRVLKEVKETISDHLPTISRFYFTETA